jgi:hypothetical protein
MFLGYFFFYDVNILEDFLLSVEVFDNIGFVFV